MPAGIAWNLRCAISTSWSQLSTLSGTPFTLTLPSRYSTSSFAHSKLCAAIASSVSLIWRAAPAAAPPSMIAMRLPTGLFDGSAWRRVRVDHADVRRIALQHLADDGRHQRLMALAR